MSDGAFELSFSEVIRLLRRYSWMAVLVSLVVAGSTWFISQYFVTRWYTSQAVIMPKTTKLVSSLDSLFGQVAVNSGGGMGSIFSGGGMANSEAMQFTQVLKSRSAVQKFLRAHPQAVSTLLGRSVENPTETQYAVATQRILRYLLVKPEGSAITIRFDFTDPVLVRDVVQGLIENLQAFLNTNVVTQSRGAELFVKDRLTEVASNVDQAEQRLSQLRLGDRRSVPPGRSLQSEISRAEREFVRLTQMLALLSQQYELSQIESKRSDPMFVTIDTPDLPLGPISPNVIVNTMMALGIALLFSHLLLVALYKLGLLAIKPQLLLFAGSPSSASLEKPPSALRRPTADKSKKPEDEFFGPSVEQ